MGIIEQTSLCPKVLGILGSPRRNSNTEMLLDSALDGVRQAGAIINKVVLNELKFRPCQECGGCDATGKCIQKDDMQSIYTKFQEVDAVIIASPIFFGSLSAQTKMMIDRFQCCWAAKYLLKMSPLGDNKKRVGFFLCVGALKRTDLFENAEKVAKIFFRLLNIDYKGSLFYSGVDARAEITARHPDALKEACEAGVKLIEQKFISLLGK